MLEFYGNLWYVPARDGHNRNTNTEIIFLVIWDTGDNTMIM